MLVGALMASVCGACTFNVMGSDQEFAGLAPFVGGVPTAVGLWMFVSGLIKYLEARKP